MNEFSSKIIYFPIIYCVQYEICINCLETWPVNYQMSIHVIKFMWSINNATKCTNNNFEDYFTIIFLVRWLWEINLELSDQHPRTTKFQAKPFLSTYLKRHYKVKFITLVIKNERVSELTVIHDTKLWWLFLDKGLRKDKAFSCWPWWICLQILLIFSLV